MPQTTYLRVAKMINFKLQIFYQNKKLQLVSIVTEIGIVLKNAWKMRKVCGSFPSVSAFLSPAVWVRLRRVLREKHRQPAFDIP